MSSMFDVLLQTVKDRFPKLNWKLGSVIRSLLLDPMERIGRDVDTYVAKATLASDISELLRHPTGRGEELDHWLAQMNITMPEPKDREGTVAVVCDGSTSITVPEGSAFSWNNGVILLAKASVTGTKDTMVKLDTGLYLLEVPVVAYGDSSVTLSKGSSVVWSSAPDTVVDMYVLVPVAGGLSPSSDQAKAAIISSALSQPLACGEEAILSSLVRRFGHCIVDVKSDTGIRYPETGYVTPLYIKCDDSSNESILAGVSAWLNSSQAGSPFSFRLTSPIKVSVKLQIDTNGSEDIPAAALGDICDYINGSKFNASLSDTDIKQILGTYGYTVERPILYTATMDTGTGVYAVSQTGGLYISPSLASEVKPVAMYCSFDNIKTY